MRPIGLSDSMIFFGRRPNSRASRFSGGNSRGVDDYALKKKKINMPSTRGRGGAVLATALPNTTVTRGAKSVPRRDQSDWRYSVGEIASSCR